jgi:MFS family permease
MPTAQEQKTAQIPRRVIWLALAGAVGGFLFGFDSSVVNGAVDAMKDEFALSEAVTGFAVAIALLGCAAGAFLAGKVADRYGRIPAMKLGALLFLVSAIGTGFAFGVWDLIFWRLVGGLGIGLASVIAPAYISEISPRKVRGRLASLQQLAITTGIFAALLSDALFATSAGGADQAFWLGLRPGAGCSWPPPCPPWCTAGLPTRFLNPRGSWCSWARRTRPARCSIQSPPRRTPTGTSARSAKPSRRTSSRARRARCAARSSGCRQWSGWASSCPSCSSS